MEEFSKSELQAKSPEKQKDQRECNEQKGKKLLNPFSIHKRNLMNEKTKDKKLRNPFSNPKQNSMLKNRTQRLIQYTNKNLKSKNACLTAEKRPKVVGTIFLESPDEDKELSNTKNIQKRSVSRSENDGKDATTSLPLMVCGPTAESCTNKRLRERPVSASAAEGRKSDHTLCPEFIPISNSLAPSNETVDKETNKLLPDQHFAPELQLLIDAVPSEIADSIKKLFEKIQDVCVKKSVEKSGERGRDADVAPQIDSASDVLPNQSIPLEQEGPHHVDNNIKYFTGYAPANRYCLSDGFGWNEEMRRFYNNSWGGENNKINEILSHMNRDKRLWPICSIDRRAVTNVPCKPEKCLNCFSFGHVRDRCAQPKRPVKCYMCGESGHVESRCPNALCLRCGSKTFSYTQSCKNCMNSNNRICPICKLRGHSLNECPDKWRRYHSTTKGNTYPDSRIIYNQRRCCCFCGKRGHLFDECMKALYKTEYPIISSEIMSHEKSYGDAIVETPYRHEIPCRLLYDPTVRSNFELAHNTTHHKTYGRFLCAVGLGQLIGPKNKQLQQPGPPNQVSSAQAPNESTDLKQYPSCSNTSYDQVHGADETTDETVLKIAEYVHQPLRNFCLIHAGCGKPSVFWSQRSLQFLKLLIDFAVDKPSVLEPLRRINKRAIGGCLSYNDYCFLVEMYNFSIVINQK